jgi:hypothetical protein
MAPEPAEPSPARSPRRLSALLRRHRVAVVAVTAPLAVMLAATLSAAAPPFSDRTEQDPAIDNPNYRRVAFSSPGVTVEILGQPDPLNTGGVTGEVDLARAEGDQSMVAANLTGSSDVIADFGQVYFAMRPGVPVDYQYDTSTQSIIFNPGIEIQAETVPGLRNGTDYLYTQPIRMLPTEPVADPQFPPYEQTFTIPSIVMLWEGADGVTGSEPIGFISHFELTITHGG